MSDWTAAQVTLNNEGVVVDSNNPLPVTISSGGASGGATSDNQVAIIAQLDDIIEALNTDTEDKRLTVRLDQVSDTLFYVGKALIGKVDADANWLIIRYTQTGSVLMSEYANGSEAFDQVWNDRATLTYV
jgi:hypothetical protein